MRLPKHSAINCMIIAAHQDDEALSFGGYALDRANRGLKVGVLNVFGRTYDYGDGPQHEEEQRRHWEESCELLKCQRLGNMALAEGEPQMHKHYGVLQRIEALMTLLQPTEVVIHDDQDRNQDHRWLSDVCKIALRPWANPWLELVLMGQSVDALPKMTNWYVPMTESDHKIKLSAVECYTRESRTGNHPRSPENLTAWHKVHGGFCAEDYAEPYRLFYSKD